MDATEYRERIERASEDAPTLKLIDSELAGDRDVKPADRESLGGVIDTYLGDLGRSEEEGDLDAAFERDVAARELDEEPVA